MIKKLQNKYFPTPAYLSMEACSFDISDQHIKYGELIKNKSGFYIEKYGIEKIKNGVIVNGKIENKDELIKVLKILKKKIDIYFVRICLVDINDLLVDEYISVFKKAGLMPLSFEQKLNVISRAVIKDDDLNPVIILDFNTNNVGMSLVYNKKTLFIDYLDIKEKSLICSDVNKIYLNWLSKNGNDLNYNPISHVVICGDHIPDGMIDCLSETMKMKVVKANIWSNIFNIKNITPNISFEESLGFASVIGLTLGNHKEDNHLYFATLPVKHNRIISFKYKLRLMVIILNFIAIIFTIGSLLLVPSYFVSKLKMDTAERNLELLNISNGGLSPKEISSLVDNTNNKLLLLLQETIKKQVNEKIIDIVLSKKPQGIKYDGIIFNRNTNDSFSLVINGVSQDKNTLDQLKKVLQKNLNTVSLSLNILNPLKSSDLDFIIMIKII